jgi:alpha-ketoglutarate-dependent taurine dioxygenase
MEEATELKTSAAEAAVTDVSYLKMRSIRRKPLNLSSETLVSSTYLEGTDQFPLVIKPEVEEVNVVTWASGAIDYMKRELERHGAILLRGFKVETAEKFEQLARTLSPELLDYRERAAPRKEVAKNIYTSTEYPPSQHIPLHHEMSYSHNWPMKIWFYCHQAALEGGATPIANDRVVIQRLNSDIKEMLIRKKVMYTRNYGVGPDLTWQDVFQTSDKTVVEHYCREAGMEFEWVSDNILRTRQVRPAIMTHPVTGEAIWFNHAHMFHVSNVEPSLRQSLLAEYREEYLPRNAYYGDGSPIEDSVLDEIRELYQQTAVVFSWRQGDVLLLDNMLASHGRQSFVGARKILVAMAELYTDPN